MLMLSTGKSQGQSQVAVLLKQAAAEQVARDMLGAANKGGVFAPSKREAMELINLVRSNNKKLLAAMGV